MNFNFKVLCTERFFSILMRPKKEFEPKIIVHAQNGQVLFIMHLSMLHTTGIKKLRNCTRKCDNIARDHNVS